MLAQVEATAAADGLCFDSTGQRAGNSEDAHRLLLWAGPRSLALFESMVKAYNCEKVCEQPMAVTMSIRYERFTP